jgi:hypothetical protein
MSLTLETSNMKIVGQILHIHRKNPVNLNQVYLYDLNRSKTGLLNEILCQPGCGKINNDQSYKEPVQNNSFSS